MLKYKIVERTKSLIKYEYQPDGNGEAGFVTINIENGDIKLEPSESDIGNRYAIKLAKRLNEFLENTEFKENGIIAWY